MNQLKYVSETPDCLARTSCDYLIFPILMQLRSLSTVICNRVYSGVLELMVLLYISIQFWFATIGPLFI